jgi:putative transposase
VVISAGRRSCEPRQGIIACDFFVAVTATFRLLYVFVLIHHGSRRLVHSMSRHTRTAAWTLQQLREAIGLEDGYRYLIHARDRVFARNLDESLKGLGLKILKSPLQSPMANALCERLIGSMRRGASAWTG